MIIWSGLGFLVVVFVMVSGVFLYDPKAGDTIDKPFAYSLLVAGIASGILGYFLRRRPARTLVDKATGKEVVFRQSHSLFFVPMIYWGPILVACALYLLITGK